MFSEINTYNLTGAGQRNNGFRNEAHQKSIIQNLEKKGLTSFQKLPNITCTIEIVECI